MRNIAAGLVVTCLVGVQDSRAGSADVATLDAMCKAVEQHFYDDDLHGLDWDDLRGHYRTQVAAAEDPKEVRRLLCDMLAELGSSHTTILDAEVYEGMMAELMNRRRSTFGVLLEESMPGRFFVRALYEGGPGDMAGLRSGDRIVAIDGVPIADSDVLVSAGYDPALPGSGLFFLRAAAPIRVTVQSLPDAETRQTRQLTPMVMNAVDAARNSVRVVEHDGVRIGTLHLWFCSRGVAGVLEEALRGPLAGCDALVLDIRGRGGYTDVVGDILDVFRGRQSLVQKFRGKRDPALWTKPLAVLIDDRSRSAKEVLSQRLRDLKIGSLVGQRTEGAVLGAMFHPLPDGSWLELAGVRVPVNGKELEGVGVPPHHDVDYVIPYSHGRDPIFDKGCDVVVGQVVAARKRARLRVY